MTWVWLVEAELGLDARGPVAENDDSGGKQQSLLHVVGDEESREAVSESSFPSGSSSSSRAGSFTSARASDAR
jgi:hypothetical protein